MDKYLAVGIGGFVGSVARFWVGSFVARKMGTHFPFGTLLINISGSFLVGLAMAILAEKTHLNANYRYLILIGVIGGYTTFSTFEFETFHAMQNGEFGLGMLNVFLSVVVGFLMVWLGVMAGKSVAAI